MLVNFSNGPTSGYSAICGAEIAYTVAVGLSGCWGGSNAIYFNGTDGVYLYIAPAQTAGNLAYAGLHAYRNGIVESGTFTPGWAGTFTNITIGGTSAGGGSGWTGSIQAYALIDRVLSAAEVWLAAQQMAHCHVNPRWNVWAPARRWFFLPPPPAAATPVLSTIYLNTADIGDTSLFDDTDGADIISATYARTGSNSFKLHDSSNYLLANLTSSATKYTRFGLLVEEIPPVTARLCAWQQGGTEHVSLWLTDGLQLEIRQGSTIIQTSPTTLEHKAWYCIETKVVVHTTVGRFQVRIDGVDDMAAIGICTDADVNGAINQIRFEAPFGDTFFDDIMVREDQWCGTGGVYVVVPVMDGTVREWATGDYTAIADLPPSFDEYIEDPVGGGHLNLVRHSGVDDLDVNVVGVFTLGRNDDVADSIFQAAARSFLTDNVGYAQELDTIGVYARLLMTTDPNGTVAWTVYAVNNALQLGVKS